MLDPDLFWYGVVTFGIHWVPGIIAAIHVVSTKRSKYGVKKTLTWAGKNKNNELNFL